MSKLCKTSHQKSNDLSSKEHLLSTVTAACPANNSLLHYMRLSRHIHIHDTLRPHDVTDAYFTCHLID